MPAERLPMRKVREVLRLKHACGVSERVIARSIGVSRSTVAEYLRRAAVIGLAWPIPPELDDARLERRLFTPSGGHAGRTPPLPDWPRLHTELRCPGVTLLLLWEEYRAEHPDGYGYSRFCALYGAWRRTISATMRQAHVAGEKLFVDFAGDTVPVFDALSGEVRQAHIFVAVLGASNYTFAQARWSEGLDWIGAHACAFGFFEGVPALVVCDNLKAGVTAACRYEPGIKPQLPGSRHPLRHDDPADAGAQAARQGQGRGRGADRRALDSRPPAPPSFLLAGRAERCDRRTAGCAQCPADAPDRRQPAAAVRVDRRAGARSSSSRTLRIHRVEEGARRSRLSHRSARPLLLGAVLPDPPDGRSARRRGHRRGLPPGRRVAATSARRCNIGTPRYPSTCRARIAATPSGRRTGSPAKRPGSVPPPPS